MFRFLKYIMWDTRHLGDADYQKRRDQEILTGINQRLLMLDGKVISSGSNHSMSLGKGYVTEYDVARLRREQLGIRESNYLL